MENESLLVQYSQSSERSTACIRLRQEFSFRKFTFNHPNSEQFYKCSWSFIPHWLFVTIRFIITVYLVSITIVSIIGFSEQIPGKIHRPWAIYLTNWSFFLLTSRMLVSTTITILNAIYLKSENILNSTMIDRMNLTIDDSTQFALDDSQPPPIPPKTTPVYVKFDWLLHSIICPIAPIVTVIYFCVLFPPKKLSYLPQEDINLHLMNSLVTLLDFLLASFPVNIMHVVYVNAYGIVYIIFSIVYWSIDKEANVIYAWVLDWNHPLVPGVVLLVAAIVVLPLFVLAMFGLYQLRCWASRKYI